MKKKTSSPKTAEKSALVLAAVHPADSCTDLADRFCLLSNVRPDHRL